MQYYLLSTTQDKRLARQCMTDLSYLRCHAGKTLLQQIMSAQSTADDWWISMQMSKSFSLYLRSWTGRSNKK